ncbi:helix-turn-helix transcriptional regulator [uncultured Ruegeria sp.]|uniref:helix-turn-helix transcriptional regulator n=1 Tax=uncultured Ruegeria sp. TaxID=259304 RepID=UPI00345B5EAB
MQLITDGKKFLSVREVADLFSCGVSTVWRLSKNGHMPAPMKIGGMARWRATDIQKWVDDHAHS